MNPRPLQWGEPAPWFHIKSNVNPSFCFDSVAGRYVVLTFLASGADVWTQQFFSALGSIRLRFDDVFASFFGVSCDPADAALGRLRDEPPGIRFFYDSDLAVCAQIGLVNASGPSPARVSVVFDERLRLVSTISEADPARHVERLEAVLAALPPLTAPMSAPPLAPILVVPRIFEPEFCEALIRYYKERGGRDSGFMRDVNGRTVEILDYNHKRRRDEEIQDEALRRECMVRIHDRLAPEIRKAFQFEATRIERYVVACYEAEEAGHFRAHRDNTTKGTAHRRFAVSLHLNTGEYEGGQLKFPEFGQQWYSAPAGGAVVFSCSLLHEATPVTRGRRFVFLPFLYDEAAAAVRQRNQKFLARN